MIYTQTFTYENATNRTLRLIIEPQAAHYLIKTGDRVDIIARGGDIGSNFLIEQTTNGVTIYVWAEAMVTVSSDNKTIFPSDQFD